MTRYFFGLALVAFTTALRTRVTKSRSFIVEGTMRE
jgi:hypothetical protein